MLRKLLVHALALIAVLAVAGGAMAAAGSNGDGTTRLEQESRESGDGAEDVDDTPGAEAKAKAGRQAHDAADEDSAEQSLTEDDDSYGAARSAEVAEYHACRDAAGEDGDDDCEKPGPAWQNDAHPVFGADGEKAGETPGASAATQGQDRREEAAAQRPERAAESDDSDDEDDAVRGAGRGKAAEAGAHGKGRAKAGR